MRNLLRPVEWAARLRRTMAVPMAIPVARALIAVTLSADAARAESLQLATLSAEGATIPGDRMTVIRPYGTWVLQCDLSVSQNRRLCAVEQTLERPGAAAVWRLARTADDRNVLVWSLPPHLNTAQGLTVKLDGFATTVSTWNCQVACIAIVPLSPTLQSLLFSATTVEMDYVTKAGQRMVLAGRMDGFRQAIQAAAEDPFGKRVPVATAAAATAAPASVKPKKPAAPPRHPAPAPAPAPVTAGE